MASNSNGSDNSIPTILAKAKKGSTEKFTVLKENFITKALQQPREELYMVLSKKSLDQLLPLLCQQQQGGQLTSKAIDKAFAGADNTFPAKGNVRKYLAILVEDSTTASKLCNKGWKKQIMLLKE